MAVLRRCFLLFLAFLASCGAAPSDFLFRVPEEQPPNTLVGSLAADRGLPDTGHLYKLEVGAPYLRVDGKTGDIYTTEIPVDRETLRDCRNLFEGDECFLEFEVSITDMVNGLGSGPRLIEGRIQVLDINDNTPQFSSPILTLSIPENTHAGALFSIPMATDRDSGANGVAEYSLSAGPDADRLFGLQVSLDQDEKLPQLVVMGNLDRERKDSYDLNVRVVDGGTPARASSALLRVTVTDQNDNAPAWERSHYEGELPENSVQGHSVLQVRANDADTGSNGEIDYSLHRASEAVQRLLRIDRSTGVIYVKGLVDREEESFLKFFVVAKDRGPNSKRSKVLVTLTVRDQNDNAPAIEIRDIGLVTHQDGVANISEDMPIGTPVALVQVSDRDEGENAVVTCVVAGNVPFQLRPASESANDRKRKYFLQTTTPLDYERVRDYRIKIVAVDSGNPALSSSNSLKVQVTDMNDNTPIFSPAVLEVDFSEGNQPGDKVLDVAAADADSGTNAELTYSIIDPAATRLFDIEADTGEIRVKNLLDREETERYEFRVAAADKGVPSKTGTATVRVNVLDRNDNDPKFMLSGYSFSVIENMPPLNPVGVVTVTGSNGEIDYSLHQASEAVQRLLRIDRSTGVIYVKGLVDREEESFLKFFVVAKDRGPNSKSSKVLVTITVRDQNDNAPAIEIRGIGLVTHQDGVANISEDMPIGTPVALVQVSDRDEGENAVVTCVVAGDVPFQLRPASESANDRKRKYFLQTTTPLDYERVRDYRIEIVAVDSGNPALSSSNSLKVQVTDMNDNTPIFSPAVLEVDFSEGNQPGDKVLDVAAADADSGTNAELTYSIIDPAATRLFDIEADTGEIRVKNLLDREETERYEFRVAAADKGVPSKTGTATVRVNVLDRNDNDPKFMLSGYSFSVIENMPPLNPVGVVTVTGSNGEIDYSLHQASEAVQRLLRIDRSTGVIYVKGLVDREEESFLKFFVVAKDRGPNSKRSKVLVTLTVRDQNDNAPAIEIRDIGLVTHQDGVANISEDMPIGTPVALVQVSDRDEGENAVVTCVVAGNVPFQLRPASESANDRKRKYFLQTTTPLDYERVRDYRIKIVAVDSGNPALSSSNSLKVQVTDMNDNTPIFSPAVLEVDFSEGNQPGDKVLDVAAADADSGTNAELTYSIIDPAATRLFDIEADTGEIRVKNLLDREETERYEFRVAAADKGVPSKTGTATVRVNVLDRNDNDPKFMLSGYSFSVIENMPPLNPVGVVTVTGSNGEIDYSLHQASEAVQRLLRIDRSTGVIYVKGLVDREEESFLKFFVVAKDRGPNSKSSKVLVTITVRDQNDNAPAIEIRGIGLVTHQDGVANISEDMPIGTPVALVQVSDRDEGENAVVTCVVAGDVPFQLRPASESANDRKRKYFLQTTTPLDYERVRDYRIEIVAVDSGNPALSSSNSLKVQVTDMNDNTPIFSPAVLEVDFSEGNQPGDKVLDVAAADADSGTNAELTYSIIDPAATRLFDIEADTGEIRVKNLLDREETERYEFRVAAADKGVPSKTGTATVRVNVLDRNDNDPKFMLSGYSFSVIENMPPLNPVGVVTVTGSNGEIDYSLHQASEAVQRLLRIDRSTGVIYVKGLVDREEESFLKFFVVAKDRGPNSKSSKVLVTITVRDQNDNAPAIEIRGIGLVTHQDGVANISEDMPIGTPVALVQVSDRDEGENAVVTCVVAGDVPFQLRPASESANDRKRKYFLQTTTTLDYERVRDYRIEIVAVDSGNPALSSSNSLKVQVTDMNDNTPIFSPAVLEVDFSEGNQPGDKVLDVAAADADSGTNAELTYSIIDPAATRLFDIEADTGEIRVKNLLDREETERYEFRVAAADKGVPSKTGTATVRVNVLDRNDNDPKFMLSGYSFSVIENMPPLNPVGVVTVTDADKGENARVRLFVEPDNGKFLIQNGTGTILSSISFDREKESTYTFRLKAVDAGDPARSSYVGVTINVLDENDNAPYVTKPANSSYTYMSPITPPDTSVEVVEAEDIDSGPNAELVYTIMGGNPYGLFHISPDSGEVTLVQEFTGKHNGLHRLVVKVSDQGKPPRHTTALVHVFVNDTKSNVSLIEALVGHSLYTPLDRDIAGG